MKFNPLFVLVGGCIAGILAVTPLLAQTQMAQANAAGSSIQTAEAPKSDHRGLRQAFEQLNLTPEQQSQFDSLRRDSRSQVEAILQPEQRQQFITTWQQGGGFRDAIAAMNLTDTQRQQMREMFQSKRSQARALLTDPQRQDLRQLLQDRLDHAL